ncbi:MAG: stage V sporulation protein AD, partial [Clostridia bacterium]|nr:stage V sporulation protein AD [Clostridia bacterium]
KVIDLGVKDANNMGAAMAPAAADTLFRHFCDTGRSPDDYDRIFSGDLGQIGSSLLKQLMKEKAFSLDENIYQDCGNMVFSPEDDVHAGASGCGCSASVLAAHILPRLESGEWKRVLFMATGALMSTVSSQQGESIPGIAHAVVFEHADCKEKG